MVTPTLAMAFASLLKPSLTSPFNALTSLSNLSSLSSSLASLAPNQ
ncbi:MAG: hypothetical protein L7H10_04375 [Vulcanisaeta sp.]|nr:hypothetical protein [Vulcanisaeta sp.]